MADWTDTSCVPSSLPKQNQAKQTKNPLEKKENHKTEQIQANKRRAVLSEECRGDPSGPGCCKRAREAQRVGEAAARAHSRWCHWDPNTQNRAEDWEVHQRSDIWSAFSSPHFQDKISYMTLISGWIDNNKKSFDLDARNALLWVARGYAIRPTTKEIWDYHLALCWIVFT